jgi:hypothetical protein
MTAGQLIKILSEVKPETPVVLNIRKGGDGRKAKLPWIDSFYLHYDEGGSRPRSVVISGYLVDKYQEK